MNLTQQRLLQALAQALQGGTVTWEADISPTQWQALYDLAQQHHIAPLIYQAVARCPAFAAAGSLAGAWKRRSIQLCMLQVRRTEEFLALYEQLDRSGIPALVVKGLVCRQVYPNGDLRLSSDEDLLISEGDFAAAHDLFLRSGMEISEKNIPIAERYEVPYHSRSSLHIELHKSLFPAQSEAYGHWNRFFEGCFERSMALNVNGVSIKTLSPTDHCFYLLCHAFKHFLHSGFGIRQVCDICLFSQAHRQQIDWDAVWDNCREIRGVGFARAVFNIGANHLGLDVPLCREVDELPMLKDLLSGGVFGSSSEDRLHSSTLTLDAVSAQKKGRSRSPLRTLFPGGRALEGRYPWLKKHPWLLPAAWGHRILRYGRDHKAASAAQSLKIGQERIALLRYYDIID